MGATTILGKVALTVRGEYSQSEHYERLDVVLHMGSSYVAKDNVRGVAPPDEAHWQLLAGRGKSAYEAAKALGLTDLTEEEWLREYDTKREAAISAIEQKGQQTRESIPDDYTTLSESVSQLSEEKFDKTSIAQKTGDSTDMVMSQKAVTEAVDAIKGIFVDEKEVKETITDGMSGYEYVDMTELTINKNTGKLYLNYKGVNNTETAIVDVSEGEIFYISGVTKYSEGKYPAVSLLFSDGTGDTYLSPDVAGYNMFLGSTSTEYTYISGYKVVVPPGAKKMYVCSILIDDESEKINIEKVTIVVRPNEKIVSVLYQKQAIFVGDSICHDSPHNSEGWAKRIADRYGMTYVNYGKDGATIANNVYYNGSLKACIATRIDTLIAQYPDADYIVIEGGTNDADLIGSILNGNIPVKFGSVQSGYNATFDEDTFCGALESIFSKCSREWRGKHIGYVVAQKMGRNADGYTPEANNRRAYFEKAMLICEKWGIPYINLWDESYLNPMIKEHYNADLSTEENESAGNLYRDGQHLTPKAYDYLAVKIGEWMKTI